MTPTRHWNRHLILAEIKTRFGSLNAFAATTKLDAAHFSVALGQPYPKAEKLISRALGVPLSQLWPDRYDAKGRRLSSRAAAAKASPERAAPHHLSERKLRERPLYRAGGEQSSICVENSSTGSDLLPADSAGAHSDGRGSQ